MIFELFEILLHLDKYLQGIVQEYSTLTYLIIFLVIFFETGIVVTPFLPGDSLLFAAGALAAIGSFDIKVLFVIILIAAIFGDAVNYHIGKYVGPKIFNRESSLFFNKEYLVKAQSFYEKHGKKTIILARFIPFIRTFAPFVAGIGVMPYRIFFLYNVLGAFLWCALFIIGGYFFGNIQIVKDNFGLLIIGIIIVSMLPLLKEIITHFWTRKKEMISQN